MKIIWVWYIENEGTMAKSTGMQILITINTFKTLIYMKYYEKQWWVNKKWSMNRIRTKIQSKYIKLVEN